MTKAKNTKRALVSSILSLIVCVSMLIGSTFAWFTDSVTSGNNKIVAGTLEVDLLMADENGNYDSIAGENAAIFGEGSLAQDNAQQTLWEPGKTQIVYLAVENKGNLDLKYNIALNVVDGGLIGSLEYAIVDGAQYGALDIYTNWATLKANAQTGDVVAGTTVAAPNGAITVAEKTEYFALAVHMKEEADNKYQGKDITIDVTVLATQLASEFDSFDNQYDVDADYVAEVKNADELAIALRTGGLVKLANDISVTESLNIPAGVVVNLDLNGKTITGTKGRDADNNRIHVIVNNGILTIKDGTVKSAGNDGGSAICNNAGATLTIEDVTLYGAPQSDPVYEAGVSKPFPSYAVNNYGNAVVNGATVKSYHGAIATGDDGVTVINDADIDVGLGQSTGITSYAIYSYGNAQVTVNGGKFAFTKQEIYVNGGNTFCELGTNPIMINGGNYIGTSFSTGADREYVIKGGTFDKDPSAYVANGYIATTNADGTYTVVKGATVASADELDKAIQKGGNVVLTDDIELTKNLMPTKDVVIDLNGNKIETTASTSLFQSQSNAHPSMIITSSKAGAVIDATNSTFSTGIVHSYGKTEIRNVTINAGSNKVVQVQGAHGSVEIYDTVINVASGNPFNVAGDFTLGEGTVVNVTNLNSSFINNSGKHKIVIDGAKINVDKFRVNGGAMINLTSGTTLALKNTEIKVGLDTTYTSYFISRAENATIENCTFDIKNLDGTKAYDIEFMPDAGVGAKYAWKQK